MRYNFDWDPEKEKLNIRKHKMDFRKASTVFRDQNQLTLYDEDHSENEDRWITMGTDNTGVLRVVIHTFEQIENLVSIRIISARKAVSDEMEQYQAQI